MNLLTDTLFNLSPRDQFRQFAHFANIQVNQQMKNMQNEPNLQNAQINVTSFTTSDYGNFPRLGRLQNEPNFTYQSTDAPGEARCIFSS